MHADCFRFCDSFLAEIPLFHVLNARITFGNIYGMDQAVDGVTFINEDTWRGCVVDDSVFNAPASYIRKGLF